jgi:hypothetical protein
MTKSNLFKIVLAFLFLVVIKSAFCQNNEGIKFIEATIKGTPGFFRVGQTTQGQWWFLDHENKTFYYRGVCAVNRAGTAGGRRATPGPYAVTIDNKYGYQQNPEPFVNACVDKLQHLGFNALGAWATEEFYNKGIPFTEILEFFKEGPFLPLVNNKSIPDIFSVEWQLAIDRKARALCSPLRSSKELVGYFTDNEIGFGKADDSGLDLGFQAGQFDFALLRQVLGMEKGNRTSESAWNFLLSRYGGSFDKLSEAWEVNVSSNDDLLKLNESKTAIPGKAYNADAQEFVKYYAEHYFELANKAIRRYDPNHLILGCRFGAPPPTYILDAIKPWTDVISANNYQPILYERYDTVYNYTGLPLLIGEFSWNTDLYKKVPFPNEDAGTSNQKERMFRRGTATLVRMAKHPGIVGYTWYRWVQGTCTDQKFYDGIVNYGDSLEMHAVQLAKLNPEMEKIRMESASGNWKNQALLNGEMTLFFDQLRPKWEHFLRITFRDGKPEKELYGWSMKGEVLNYSNKKDDLSFKITLDFQSISGVNNPMEAARGIYEFKLKRAGEKYYGNFNGKYNGKSVSGSVKAFYFQETYTPKIADN